MIVYLVLIGESLKTVNRSIFREKFIFRKFFSDKKRLYFRMLNRYTTASTESAAFIIGGVDLSPQFTGDPVKSLSIVAEFSKQAGEAVGSWKHRGNLLQARNSLQAITYMDQTLVFGGYLESEYQGLPM